MLYIKLYEITILLILDDKAVKISYEIVLALDPKSSAVCI